MIRILLFALISYEARGAILQHLASIPNGWKTPVEYKYIQEAHDLTKLASVKGSFGFALTEKAANGNKKSWFAPTRHAECYQQVLGGIGEDQNHN
jgi:hypothetical protein